MNHLLEYLKNSKVTRKRLDAEIRDERNQVLPQRDAYVLLKKYAKEFFSLGSHPRMVALSGLRGVGKTTLMWQTANYVYKNHSTQIFFININDLNRLNASIYDVMNALEKDLFHSSLNEIKEKIMLMFDEVHEAQNWQNDLKLLYERGKKIFVLATGSSALLLHSNSDLASRWTLKKIFPFRFPEFILAKSWLKNPKQKIFLEKDLAEEISALLFYSPNFNTAKRIKSKEEQFIEYFEVVEKTLGEKLNQLLDDYISYHNIARFLPLSNKTLVMERVLALFEQVLLRDIPNMDINLLNVFNRILFRLALSDLVNFQTLSRNFDCRKRRLKILSLH